MTEGPRYALYFTPAHAGALERFGAAVVGRSLHCEDTAAMPAVLAPLAPAITARTNEPRRYGFHATLKAPFRLAGAVTAADLVNATRDFCAVEPPVVIGPLKVALLGGFVALVPIELPVALSLFAARCVTVFDGFRAPVTEDERKRRRVERLSPRQSALLARWGYPYVLEEFRFHMTLTNALALEERESWRAKLACAYEASEVGPVTIDALSILRQGGQSDPFRLIERIALRGLHPAQSRLTAPST